MDYSLAALKLLCSQLKHARETPSQSALTLGGILFQRAWLQGILVYVSPDGDRLLLDDATGVAELHLSADFRLRPWNNGNSNALLHLHFAVIPTFYLSLSIELSLSRCVCFAGMYVLVVGAYVIRTGEPPMIKVSPQTKKI